MTKLSLQAPPEGNLRIAVIGMGGIGSAFAFQLARTGHHEVTAIARPGSARLEQLKRDGGIVNTRDERADMHLADSLDESVPYDLILVTLPAHRLAPVLASLQRSSAAWIQFMFNTFEPEQLRDTIGADRCSFGMPFIQASLEPDGRLSAKIGAGGQKTKMNNERWTSLFNAAQIPAVFEPEMLLWLRCHVPLCVAFESISVAAMRRGRGASWAEAITIARGLQAGLTLVQRLGYRLYPAGKARLQSAPVFVPASLLWSVSRIPSFRKLLATGIDECAALVDLLVKAARVELQPPAIARIEAMKP